MYDIIIIGGGPAGLTAALYARRANKSVLVIEKNVFGGQITFSPKVENIPGFISLSGNEFAEKLVDQVIEQGGEFEPAEALEIKDGKVKTVVTDTGSFEAKAVIISTGAKHRLLGLEGEERFIGNGISFCAVCDGAFYKDKTVAVVGGGNSAMQEAILLSDLCSKIYLIQNLDFLTGEKKLEEEVRSKNNVSVITGTVVDGYIGNEDLIGVRTKSVANGEVTDLAVDGVFLAIGLVPQNEAFKNVVSLNERGYALADESLIVGNGLFVAGDCRVKAVRQVTTACSDGAVAALNACRYVDDYDKA